MRVWLKNAYSRPFRGRGLGTFPKWRHSSSCPKNDRSWDEPRHLSHKARISVARFELGVGTRIKGQDRKKVTRFSPICEEAPTEAMHIKICLVGDVLDVITCAKFQNTIFGGYDFTRVEIFIFSERTTLRSLYAIADPSVVCRLYVVCLSVTLVHPTQPVEIFGNFFHHTIAQGL